MISYLRNKNHTPYVEVALLGPLVVVLLVAAAFVVRSHPVFPLALVGFAFVLLGGWKLEAWVLLVLGLVCVLPLDNAVQDFSFYPVAYQQFYSVPILVILYSLLYFHRAAAPLADFKRLHGKEDDDIMLVVNFLLVVYIIFLFMRGLAANHPFHYIRAEFFMLLYYVSYPFWTAFLRDHASVYRWLKIFSLVAFATALLYFMFIATTHASLTDFIFVRLVTRQGQMVILALPVVLTFALLSKKKHERVLFWLITLALFLFAFSLQQRTLWLTFVLMTPIYFLFFAFKHGPSTRAWITVGIGFMVVAILFFGLMWVLATFLHLDPSDALERWKSLIEQRDISVRMRYIDGTLAMRYWTHSPLLGLGIGSHLFTVPTAGPHLYMDNSYVMILMKGGVVFLALILVFYLIPAKRAFYVYRQSKDVLHRMIGASVFTTIIGIILYGMTMVNMLYYRFIFLYMFVFAIASKLYFDLKAEKENS
ncbi:hypothetical protein GF324_03170 [bacterium]|nr:hypothetical protein [bacterium]